MVKKWKKTTLNSKNNDDNCFQYVTIAALNDYPERISNLKSFIDQYDWKGISFSSKQ